MFTVDVMEICDVLKYNSPKRKKEGKQVSVKKELILNNKTPQVASTPTSMGIAWTHTRKCDWPIKGCKRRDGRCLQLGF